ncbi:class I SAM-dependent methyltransferase [Paracoccus sp. Z118]|uniref:class I SAM-dependent methyltransferase n=1 Tax=Paracoccus sp. Z118 TaxID=2851017 RepID=UPI001C2B8952|nr:class I SAM-dependent methyltransferase [Paracoccus sp. Z118]MBV0890689.1 class I SAM-dependent methyltransferase [Paracoccus sp. Z118]
MTPQLSPRLAAAVHALPLREGMAVLEIGCGPGAMARETARIVGGSGHVLGLDRSARAIGQARAAGGPAWLDYAEGAIEDFAPADLAGRFDLAVALRVGVLDGRHPEGETAALRCIAHLLAPGGQLFIDGQDATARLPR